MIYNSLRVLPMVTCVEIAETGNVMLLTDERFIDVEKLHELWERLQIEWRQLQGAGKDDRAFNLFREVEYQRARYQIIKSACDGLLFERNQLLIDVLSEHGYDVRDNLYLSDVERVLRESEGITNIITNLEKGLPKVDEATEFDILDTMAAYSTILGFDFDFYGISVEKFYKLENQVKRKIATATKRNKPTNNKKAK